MEEDRVMFVPKFVDRKNSGSLKFDGMVPLFGRGDLEPFWVADMDFEAPQCVVEAIASRAGYNVYGYPTVDGDFFEAIAIWFEKRFNAVINKEWIVPMTGVAASMFTAVMSLSEQGDGIVVQPPVYGPFFGVVKAANRKLIENPLIVKDGRYAIDFENLEEIFRSDSPKILLFCSPHNPGGRVWEVAELQKLVQLCVKYDVLIVSDEIHFDLVFAPYKHTTLASFEDILDNLVLLSAPTKSFNIPGLNVSYAVIPNRLNRKKFEALAKNMHQTLPNVFGIEALKSAYINGDSWIDGITDYLCQNKIYIDEFVKSKNYLNGFSPEGTYLYWIDFGGSGLLPDEISEMLKDAGVALSGGDFFYGGQKTTFFRFNFATSSERVRWALWRIEKLFG